MKASSHHTNENNFGKQNVEARLSVSDMKEPRKHNFRVDPYSNMFVVPFFVFFNVFYKFLQVKARRSRSNVLLWRSYLLKGVVVRAKRVYKVRILQIKTEC